MPNFVHAEATTHLDRSLQEINGLGKKAGMALNPATPPEASRSYLVVREGRPRSATRTAPDGGPSTTLYCPADGLLAALAGEPVPGVRVDGDVGAFLSLRKWIKRAQSE